MWRSDCCSGKFQMLNQLALRVLQEQNSMGVKTVVVVNFKRATNSRYEFCVAQNSMWRKDCYSCKFLIAQPARALRGVRVLRAQP